MRVLVRNNIARIDVSFFAHATEDQNKVLDAVRNLVPSDCVDQVTFSKSNLKGEYGNAITFFKTQITEMEISESILKNLSINLSPLDKETLLRELDLRLKKGSLYIRLDKQDAFKGKFRISQADPIHVRIKFKTSKIEEIKEICRKVGILP